jgi:group I intron endonuclease
MTNSCVYKITNKINNKIYIGKANNPFERWKEHLNIVKDNTKHGHSFIHSAIKKYGKDNFEFEIIGTYNTECEALDAEIIFIEQYKSNINKYGHDFGYNLTSGGDGVIDYKPTKEQIEKSANSRRGKYKGINNANYGKKYSYDHKRKISESNKGKIVTDEVKEKISIANSGERNGQYGKKYSLKERQNLSEKISAAKNKKLTKPQVFSQVTIDKLKVAVKEKSSQKLTDEQKDTIIVMYDSGNFLKRDLANQFNVEEKTIKYVIRYWNAVKNNKSNHLTQFQKDNIIEYYLKKEYTKKEISNIVNIPLNKIVSVIKMYKNKLNKST